MKMHTRSTTVPSIPDSSSFGSQKQPGASYLSKSDRKHVTHNYHDHAEDPPVASYHVHPKEYRFPDRLYRILDDASGLDGVLSWAPHGRCFAVHDRKAFVERILPSCFRQTKLTSFQRQLNIYCFKRITAGPDKDSYYHELFLRGRPDLCQRIVRRKLKGNGKKDAPSPRTEPNFYFMQPSDGVGAISRGSLRASQQYYGGGSDRNTGKVPVFTPPSGEMSFSPTNAVDEVFQSLSMVGHEDDTSTLLSQPMVDFAWDEEALDQNLAEGPSTQQSDCAPWAASVEEAGMGSAGLYEPIGLRDASRAAIDMKLLQQWFLNRGT